MQKLLADRGNGVVSRNVFDYAYVEGRRDFLLTLGRWNENRRDYNQTSRHSGNLVLQVNFNAGHDREFMRVIGPSGREEFVSWGHPVMQAGDRRYFRHTMAWVRMDVDFETDEVLIEEVQTDWLRDARWYLRNLGGNQIAATGPLLQDGSISEKTSDMGGLHVENVGASEWLPERVPSSKTPRV